MLIDEDFSEILDPDLDPGVDARILIQPNYETESRSDFFLLTRIWIHNPDLKIEWNASLEQGSLVKWFYKSLYARVYGNSTSDTKNQAHI